MRYAPVFDVLKAQRKGDRQCSTIGVMGSGIFQKHQLAIGLDLGDRWSYYCVLDEVGKLVLEQKLPTSNPACDRAHL